jgi:hypothetical protein
MNNYFGNIGNKSLDGLTQHEIDQIANMGTNSISTTSWGYLSTLNQSVSSLSSPAFQAINVAGDIKAKHSNDSTGG